MRMEVVWVSGYNVLSIRPYRVADLLDSLSWYVSPATCLLTCSCSQLWLQPGEGALLTTSISRMLAYCNISCLLSNNMGLFPVPLVAIVASPQPRTPARSATPRTPFPVHAEAESPLAAELGRGSAAVVALPVLAFLRIGFAMIDNAGEGRRLNNVLQAAGRHPRAHAGGKALHADLTDMQATDLGAAAEYHKLGF